MRLLALLFATGCAAHVIPAPPADPCAAPDFGRANCYDPGGGLTRCAEEDGTYWDKQPTGGAVHWGWCPADPSKVVTICTVSK